MGDSKGQITTKDLSITVLNPILKKPEHLNQRAQGAHFDVWYTTDKVLHPIDGTSDVFATKIRDFFEQAYQIEVVDWKYEPGASKDDSGTSYNESERYQYLTPICSQGQEGVMNR